MTNETEKITINLGVVELAQIDVLVEQGIYSNRSDFIRTAIRKDLEVHSDKIERQLIPIASKAEWSTVIGIAMIGKSELEEFIGRNEKLNISVIGVLVFKNDISTQLFEKAVGKVSLRGKLVASNEIKEVVARME